MWIRGRKSNLGGEPSFLGVSFCLRRKSQSFVSVLFGLEPNFRGLLGILPCQSRPSLLGRSGRQRTRVQGMLRGLFRCLSCFSGLAGGVLRSFSLCSYDIDRLLLPSVRGVLLRIVFVAQCVRCFLPSLFRVSSCVQSESLRLR